MLMRKDKKLGMRLGSLFIVVALFSSTRAIAGGGKGEAVCDTAGASASQSCSGTSATGESLSWSANVPCTKLRKQFDPTGTGNKTGGDAKCGAQVFSPPPWVSQFCTGIQSVLPCGFYASVNAPNE